MTQANTEDFLSTVDPDEDSAVHCGSCDGYLTWLELDHGCDDCLKCANAKSRYSSLADAAVVTGNDVYSGDAIEVWYYLNGPGHRRPLCCEGSEYARENGELPDPGNLEATHAKIGTIGPIELSEIWALMQGETWSPGGQAVEIIVNSGTGHTSMSTGDIVVVDGKVLMLDSSFAERPYAELGGAQ